MIILTVLSECLVYLFKHSVLNQTQSILVEFNQTIDQSICDLPLHCCYQ